MFYKLDLNLQQHLSRFLERTLVLLFNSEEQPNMTVYFGPKLLKLRDPRDEAFYLFLSGTSSYLALQIWLNWIVDLSSSEW